MALKVKMTVKKGKIVFKPIEHKQKKRATGYERYVNLAKGKYHLKDSELLSKGEYEMNITAGIEKAKVNKDPGRRWNAEKLARAQAQGENTDREIRAMWKAAKRMNPDLTKREFISNKGWEDIKNRASALYDQLRAQYPLMSTLEMSRIIGQQIYGSD